MKRRTTIIGLVIVALVVAVVVVWRQHYLKPEKVIVTWQGKPEFTRYRQEPPP